MSPADLHLAVSGVAVLTLYPRGQGESCQEWTLEHTTKLTYHMTDKERFYDRGAWMDCVRGLDFLTSRPSTPCWRGVRMTAPRSILWGARQPP